MYLKSLEMTGFKSFAERTLLEFGPGMSAIVGPNGCGKSNVSDAIRWALGEQSAKALRGGAMTDVIFNGTDGSKPLNMAEVSLTLADCEAALGTDRHEVTVTRRVFRSGEGQYLLNKTPCRLRDVQRLFMDTGLGTNSYGVMEQGRIDQLLSSRPEERREVFEEASGISKYKADKKEALRKLENTEANLLRLGDVLREVKRQLGSLQRQVGKARRFREMSKELRELELWEGRRGLLSLEGEEARAREGREANWGDETRLGERAAADGKRLEAAEEASRSLEESVSRAMEAGGAAGAELSREEDALRLAKERLAEVEGRLAREGAEEKAAGEEVARLREALAALEGEASKAAEAVSSADGEARERQGALASHDASLMALRREAQAAGEAVRRGEASLARLKGELEALEARERDDALRRERAEAERGEAERTAEAHREHAETVKGRLAAAQEAVGGAETAVSVSRGKLGAARGDTEAARQALSDAKSRVAAREAQVALLEKTRAEARGYPEGNRALLEGRALPGAERGAVLGALADALRADSKCRLALQAVLRAVADALVAADGERAVEIVRAASAAGWGSVRLLPAAGWGSAADPTPDAPGEALLSHVKVAPGCEALAAALLGRVRLVGEDEFSAALPPGYTYVTRGGLLRRADGAVEYESPRARGDNPLELAARLAEWREDLAVLQHSTVEAAAALDAALRAEDAAREAMTAAEKSLAERRREAALLEGESRLAERQARDAASRLAGLSAELDALRAKAQGAETRRAEARERVAAAEAADRDAREAAAALAERLRVAEGERLALYEAAAAARLALSEARQAERGVQLRAEPLKSREADLLRASEARRASLAEAGERRDRLVARLAEAESRLPGLREAAASCAADLDAAREERAAAQAALSLAQNALRDSRDALDAARSRRVEADGLLERLRLRRESLLERLARDYQVSRDEVAAAAQPASFPADASADAAIAELRQRIQALGPVNDGAIEEYRELEERHAFLSQQNDDLEAAKAELRKLIANLNDTTTRLFADTFRKVNENFGQLFAQLFGGGEAHLALVDEENVLESGIDIVARPPGKKPQSVSLLSGGERTLTALSLLFALFRVKPSPFCLTDELDAALDDHNISRYLDMLAGFVRDTQFLVISHNRQTIARASALYGVTMEKRGISKLVSVKFRPADGTEPAPPAAQKGDSP